MADEYTPDKAAILRNYGGTSAGFDRWLAARDAEVAAQALNDAADAAHPYMPMGWRNWLRARAARIGGEGQ